jgi:23S rRNA pseudouridine1911/1915/1917 synthase
MSENVPRFQSRPRRPPPEPEAIDIRVLYEDDALMAVDKPPGMVVHPTYRNWSGTLLNALLWHLRRPADARDGRAGVQPSIVTRLDKDTSGIVLVALAPEVHARMQRDSIAGLIRKEYLAIVDGVPSPGQGSIILPLGRSPEDRRRVIVTPAGQQCHTTYEVVSSHAAHALVRCQLVTGRTHQIRVHLAAQGWPVTGDCVYGDANEVGRQALHAWRISLAHPITGGPLHLESPVPADLQQLISDLKLVPGERADAWPPSQ